MSRINSDIISLIYEKIMKDIERYNKYENLIMYKGEVEYQAKS